MMELLNGFVVLRNGLLVSLTENLDAMEAVQHIPIDDREAFKYALGATLIKNNSHWRAFETVFEVYFSLRRAGVPHRRRRRRRPRRDVPRDAGADAPGRGRGAAGGGMEAADAGDRPPADAGAAQRRPGDDAGDGPPGGAALRRDGAGGARSAGRTTCTARCATSTSTGCWRS